MIRIRIEGSPGQVKGFLIWGHAGSRPAGRDIVCAGVSALATTCLLGLEAYLPDGFRFAVSGEGIMFCRLKDTLSPDENNAAQVLLGTMVRGCVEICRENARYVDFAYRR